MTKKLLLVEDDASNRLTLSILLEDEGYEVDVASSYAEAARMITEVAGYAVIVLDQQLGDGLGLDLIPAIRERLPSAKAVLISGSLPGDETAALRADAMVAKGAPFPETLASIQRVTS